MSFVSDAISWITDGFGSLFNIGSKIVSGAGDILQSSGITALLTTITTITNNIDTLITSFSTTLKGIVDPISASISSITNLARDIQDKIIAPIVTPIETTIHEISSLSTSINKLVDQGIGGLLQIPGAIADALTGIDKSWSNSTRQLAEANAKIVSETLVPGFASFVTPGLQDIAAGVIKFSTPGKLTVDPLLPIGLEGDIVPDKFKEGVGAFNKMLESPQGIVQEGIALLYKMFCLIPMSLANQEAAIEAFVDTGRYGAPYKNFGVSDALSLWTKGIITEKAAREQMQYAGFNADKQTALLESAIYLPGIQDALNWWQRGLIDQAQLDKVMAAHGTTTDQRTAIRAASAALLSPGLLVDMLARKIITQEDFDDQLRAQGYDADRVLQFIKASIAPPNTGAAIAAKGNELAASKGWFASTYGSAPPDDVMASGLANRRDTAEINAAWVAHFNAMPIQTAITLFFRGEMNRDEVKIVVAQNNYPADMVDLFITAYSQLVYPRTIPTLLAAGTITEAQALDSLKKRGYTDDDAHLMIADALQKLKDSANTPKTDATKLTVAQLTAAYKDAVIDADTYRTLLATHGLVGNDLDVTIALADYDILATTKKNISDTIKAELQLGVKTFDEAIQALYDAGFTNPEVERLAVTYQQAISTNAKIPSLDMFSRFAKKGLIDRDTFLAGVQALGYGAPWDEIIVDDVLGVPDNAPQSP